MVTETADPRQRDNDHDDNAAPTAQSAEATIDELRSSDLQLQAELQGYTTPTETATATIDELRASDPQPLAVLLPKKRRDATRSSYYDLPLQPQPPS